MPIQRILHFKTKLQHGNPEGISVLRNAYKPYYYVNNIEKIEAIAIERELAGLPVMHVPSAALKSKEHRYKYEQIARDVKNNKQGGVVFPSDLWKDTDGNPTSNSQYKLELLSSGGSRAIDTDKVIKRHQYNMMRTVLADFLMLGTDKGSFSLSKDKSQLFLRSLEGYLSNICSELNRKWVGTLWDLNGFDDEMKPRLTTGRIAPVDLEELGSFIRDTNLISEIDEKAEEYLREVSGLPAKDSGETIE